MTKLPMLLLGLLLAANPAFAQRPPAFVPTNPDVVLETLPRGYPRPVSPQDPADIQLPRIQSMLDAAARTGDTRLSTRAKAMLDRVPSKDMSIDVLRAKAFSAQHRHDFDQSRELLTQILQRDPTDGTLLSRAQVNIVQGHLNKARNDCVSLALRVDAGLGTICTAALQLRMGDYSGAARLTDRWLAGEQGDPGLQRFVLVMRGDIASRNGDANASHWFEQAISIDPEDIRTRLAFARHLRRAAQPEAALEILRPAMESDTVLLQRVLASQETGTIDATRWSEQLGRRFRLARATGSGTELRDEAEYYLTVRKDIPRGLELAVENFHTQRDIEDEELLRHAAREAGKPDALKEMQAWERSERLPINRDAETTP